jgi:hypothetical protein
MRGVDGTRRAFRKLRSCAGRRQPFPLYFHIMFQWIISQNPAVSGNASNPCKTVTFQRNYTGAGITIAWLKMVTTWCYNNVTVTSHTTILYWGVTAFGSGLGWYIQHSTPNYSFNCYVASGSTCNCSGNHEATKQFWRDGSAGVGLALTVSDFSRYQGK